MKRVTIKICDTVEDAPNYNTNGEGFEKATFVQAIVVRNGTEEGQDTVDLQFIDENGHKFIAMTTANIIKTLAGVIK